MYKAIYFILPLIVLCLTLSAGPDTTKIKFRIDSVEKRMVNQPDSLKIKSLLELAKLNSAFNPQKSLIYCFRAKDLFGKSGDLYYDFLIHEALLRIYSRLNINDKMIETVQHIIKIAQANNDILTVARMKRNLSVNYRKANKTDLAIKELNQSMEILAGLKKDCTSGYFAAACLRDLGGINRDLGNYDAALKFFSRSDSVCNIYVNDSSGDKLPDYLKPDKRTDKIVWQTIIAFNINDSGDSYELSKRYKEAEICYIKALEQSKKTQTPSGSRIAYLNLASVYKKMGDFKKALDFQMKSMEVSKKNYGNSYQLIDNIYLFGIYSGMRDNDNAQKTLFLLENTLNSYEMSEMLTEVETRYEMEKREKQSEIKKLELNREKNILYIFLLIILVLVLIIGSMVFYKFKENKVNKLKLEQGKTKAELLALQGKINPHFLFNSLNSLASLINSNNPNAGSMLQNLSRLLRYTLQSSQKLQVPLSEEINIVKNYLEIELFRLADRLVYEIDCPKEFENILIPPMIIQPLVENSIKHAISKMIDGGVVKIKCQKEHNFLRICIIDNGLPENNEAKLTSGFGLDYIRDILQLTYGRSNLMTIKQTNGFEVCLLIPLT